MALILLSALKKIRKLEGGTVFILSYLLAILLGGLLLWLPFSNPRTEVSFLDALFTATSALCVTGLTVVDTGTSYNYIGQIIILLLIQTGGLGITTFSVWFFLSLGRDISFKSRFHLQASFSPRPMDELRGLLRLIFFFTLLIEACGAFILLMYWGQWYSFPRALYLSIFHSISAFCNAGFSLFPDNLVKFQGSYTVSLTIALLIIFGGIGFPVTHEIYGWVKKKGERRRVKLSLHSRLVLITTGILVFGGTLVLYGIEYNDTLESFSIPTRIMISFFQSVTTRTAGFNTLDMASLTNASLLVMIILMFIGASPGSCGGGIRTTTFALLAGLLWNRLKGKKRVHLFRRTVPEEVISRAIFLVTLAGSLILMLTTLILLVESGNLPFLKAKGGLMEVLFEVVSAFGTVGLSLGITPGLEPASKFLIIISMYLGRVGILSLGYSIAKKGERYPISYGEEGVMTG
ncbi:MAG: potassium transporter [Deltaproteobacteria bacterium]|nr:potassium transporter [Deltaproteobacteria bacterium]